MVGKRRARDSASAPVVRDQRGRRTLERVHRVWVCTRTQLCTHTNTVFLLLSEPRTDGLFPSYSRPAARAWRSARFNSVSIRLLFYHCNPSSDPPPPFFFFFVLYFLVFTPFFSFFSPPVSSSLKVLDSLAQEGQHGVDGVHGGGSQRLASLGGPPVGLRQLHVVLERHLQRHPHALEPRSHLLVGGAKAGEWILVTGSS